MDVYRLKPEGLAHELGRIVMGMTAGLLYVEAVVALALLLLMRPAPSPVLLGGVLLLIAVSWAIALQRRLARARAAWHACELGLTEDGRLRLRRQGTDLWMGHEEVTEILEFPTQGMFLFTAQPTRFVAISRMVERYEEVRERLARWRPIEQGAPHVKLDRRPIVGLGLLFLGVWLSVGRVPEVWWAMTPGVLVLALATLGIVRLARSEDMPRSTRVLLIGWMVLLGFGGSLRLMLALVTRLLAPEAP